MYAYIKDNKLAFISSYELEELPETADEVIEYSDEITNPEYKNGEIIHKPTILEIENNKIKEIIEASDLSKVNIDGIMLSDEKIGDIILARVFNNNPHAESAIQAKTSAYILSALAGNPNNELLQEIQEKQAKINEVRNLFGLTKL